MQSFCIASLRERRFVGIPELCEREATVKSLAKNNFGSTGLQVTHLGLGAFPVGQADISEKEAERLLNGVLDAGINLIDTARGYGLSEERIGRYIAHRRDEYVLSTKVGYDIEGYADWSRGAVQAGIERALRLLRTDVLDIVHLHSCELESLQNGEAIQALEQARLAGKIRLAAYSGENEALDYAIACGGFQSVQFSVNICDQRAIRTALAQAQERGLGVIAKRPVANVFWQYTAQPVGQYAEEYWLRARAMQLKPPASLSWHAFALRFSAYTPGVHSSIVGTGSLGHFLESVDIIQQGALPEEIYQTTRHAFDRLDRDWVGQT